MIIDATFQSERGIYEVLKCHKGWTSELTHTLLSTFGRFRPEANIARAYPPLPFKVFWLGVYQPPADRENHSGGSGTIEYFRPTTRSFLHVPLPIQPERPQSASGCNHPNRSAGLPDQRDAPQRW